MKTLILFTIAICLSKFGFTQTDFRRGYIVTIDGDTTSGLLNYREGSKVYETCDYRNSETQNTITYHPHEIIGYGFVNDKIFESKKIPEKDQSPKLVFVEVIVKGRVSLYKFGHIYFLEKSDAGLQPLINESKKGAVE